MESALCSVGAARPAGEPLVHARIVIRSEATFGGRVVGGTPTEVGAAGRRDRAGSDEQRQKRSCRDRQPKHARH